MERQSQRLIYLDLMRVIAMMMMIVGHSFFDLVKPDLYSITQFPWNFWDFLRGLTAPTFLLISGIVQVFANKRINSKVSPEIVYKRIKTALLLIFLGYFLNFPVQRAFHIFFVQKSILIPFFQINVLQLIGVTLLWVLAYFLLTKDNKQLGIISLVTGIIIFILTPFVHLVNWYEYLPMWLAPYFSLSKGSYFPIFPFSGFIFFGVAFGTYLERFKLEERPEIIRKVGFQWSLPLVAFGTITYFLINLLNLPFYDIYKGNPGMSIIRLGLVLMLLALITFLHQKYLSKYEFINYFAKTLGKNALVVYFVHLVILYGLPWYPSFAVLHQRQFGILESFTIAILVMVSSFSIIFAFENIASHRKLLKPLFKYGLVSLFILLALV